MARAKQFQFDRAGASCSVNLPDGNNDNGDQIGTQGTTEFNLTVQP
jgi:hypothetical protein